MYIYQIIQQKQFDNVNIFRNKTRQLDDIKFEFVPGKDKPRGIASELESAGLIDSLDVDVIADNLNTLVCQPVDVTCASVTFPLASDFLKLIFNYGTNFQFYFQEYAFLFFRIHHHPEPLSTVKFCWVTLNCQSKCNFQSIPIYCSRCIKYNKITIWKFCQIHIVKVC